MKHILIIACLVPLSICPSFGQNRVLQRHLLFDIGKSALRPYEVFMLGEVVDSIRLETLTDYQIECGNTHNTGSASYNPKLSAERCAAVRQFCLPKAFQTPVFKHKPLAKTRQFLKTAVMRASNSIGGSS